MLTIKEFSKKGHQDHKATACRDSAQDGGKGSLHPASRVADASFSELTTNHSGLGRELRKTAVQDSSNHSTGFSTTLRPGGFCRELGAFSQVEHQLRS